MATARRPVEAHADGGRLAKYRNDAAGNGPQAVSDEQTSSHDRAKLAGPCLIDVLPNVHDDGAQPKVNGLAEGVVCVCLG